MVGTGEAYLPAFLLSLGSSAVSAGLVATLPLLGGGILQLLTPWAVRRLGSRKRWVFLCAAVQAGVFLPLIAIAGLGAGPIGLVFLLATLYWGAGMAAGPPWSAWIGTIVRGSIRSRYFARRSRATQIGTAVSLFVAGGIIQVATQRGAELLGFAAVFLLALLARGISAALLLQQDEPAVRTRDRDVSLRPLLASLRPRGGNRFLLVMLAMSSSVMIAGPFFTPFMIEELELSYVRYVGLIGTAFVAKVVALSWLGSFVRRFGANRTLRIAAAGIVPLSALWIFSDDYVYLFLTQCLSGTIWAMYELAAFLLFFENIEEEDRTSLLTFYNLGNTVAVAVGSALGGILLAQGPSGAAAYHWVFAVSSVLRLATVVFLLRMGFVRVERVAEDLRSFALSLRAVAIRPSSGAWLGLGDLRLPRHRRPIVRGGGGPAEDGVATEARSPEQ